MITVVVVMLLATTGSIICLPLLGVGDSYSW
jgi:hypothetical protein